MKRHSCQRFAVLEGRTLLTFYSRLVRLCDIFHDTSKRIAQVTERRYTKEGGKVTKKDNEVSIASQAVLKESSFILKGNT